MLGLNLYTQDSFVPVLVIQTEALVTDSYFSHDVRILTKRNLGKLKKQIRDFFKEFNGYNFTSITPEFVNQNSQPTIYITLILLRSY